MPALNESRAWEQAHAPESLCPAETWAYMAAENSKGHSIARDFLDANTTDTMLIREDATAERGSTAERIVGGVASVLVGGAFIVMIALTIWGWIS